MHLSSIADPSLPLYFLLLHFVWAPSGCSTTGMFTVPQTNMAGSFTSPYLCTDCFLYSPSLFLLKKKKKNLSLSVKTSSSRKPSLVGSLVHASIIEPLRRFQSCLSHQAGNFLKSSLLLALGLVQSVAKHSRNIE